MRLQLFMPALVLLLLHNQLGAAHPPTHSDKTPAVTDIADDDGGGGDSSFSNEDSAAGTTELEVKQSTSPSNVAAKTTATESATITIATPSTESPLSSTVYNTTFSATSTSRSTSLSSSSSSSSTTPMQPAFVYEAALPKHIEADRQQQLNEASYRDEAQLSNSERDGDSSKKIIGSSVVTSVSVILNGNEPEFTDALGNKVPKPLPSLQVASPINLLNPDRYEFYTFDDNGELIKRLMTMQEIQSIVANGDGEGPSIIHTAPIDDRDPERNVQDIVQSVQSVLSKQVESNRNATTATLPVLDTPDVSSSWSMILPAIFGNTGGEIFPQPKPQQIVMTPDSELLETSTKLPPPTRPSKKPKPSKRKPGQKRKTSTTTTTEPPQPQVVQEELGPNESVYTGMQQYQNMASNIKDFEGFSQLHMQPIYHKLPELMQVETTTRRIFVNNQEIIQTTSDKRPVTSTEKTALDENFSKKPSGQQSTITQAHRNKKPNGGATSTRRPQVTSNKQKIKKKPTTPSSALTTSTTPGLPMADIISDVTSLTDVSSLVSVMTTPATLLTTTQKKKKKKPTNIPGNTAALIGQTSNPPRKTQSQIAAQKRRPTARPAALHADRPVHGQQQHNKNRPSSTSLGELGGNKKTAKPSHTQQQEQQLHNKYRPPLDLVAEPSETQKTTHKNNKNKQRPRPHKPTSRPITPISTTVAPPISNDNVSPVEGSSLIVEEFPGLTPLNLDLLTKTEKATAAPLTVSGVTTPKAAINKDDSPFSASETAPASRPVYATGPPSSQYSSQPEKTEESPLKRKPLPSQPLTQPTITQTTQNELQQEQKPASPIQDDLHTILSIDKIMQTLKQDDNKDTEKTGIDLKPSIKPAKQPVSPVKYDSAESVDELQEMAKKKQKPVFMPETPPVIQTIISSKPIQQDVTTALADEIQTTEHHYGDDTTYSPSSEETKETTVDQEELTPASVITVRPQLITSTKKPEKLTTDMPVEEQTTELAAGYTEQMDTTVQHRVTTLKPTKNPVGEQSHVVKFEHLYADLQDPKVTELTTTTEPPPTDIYGENEEQSTVSDIAEYSEGSTESTAESTHDENTFIMLQTMSRLPVNTPQIIESVTTDKEEATSELPKPIVGVLKPQLSNALVKPSEQITMSDFQLQAATVASTLVDGGNTFATETNINLNDTRNEIEYLMSDVIPQITGNGQYMSAEEDRLSNLAQLNTSFLLKPVKGSTIKKENRPAATPQMRTTTELPKKGEAQQPPHVNKISATYEKVDITTIIPSKEAIIKEEEKYLTSLKQPQTTTEIPASFEQMEDTTTEVSETHTEENHDGDQLEAHSDMEREKTTETPNGDLLESATTENWMNLHSTTSQEQEKNTDRTTSELMDTSEKTMQSIEKTSGDTSMENRLHDLPNMKGQPTAEESQQETTTTSYMNENNTERTIEQKISEDQNSEAYIKTTNAPEKENSEQDYGMPKDSSGSTDYNTGEDMKESSTEQLSLSLEKLAEQESASNSDQIVPQHASQTDDKSSFHETESAAVEYSTQLPEISILHESDSESNLEHTTVIFEPTTIRYNDQSVTNEEDPDELIATVTADSMEDESDERDPYEKLGEGTKMPIKNTTKEAKPEVKEPTKFPALETTPTRQTPALKGHQTMSPTMTSNQTLEQDEEDEEDQVGYQTTATARISTRFTTTKASIPSKKPITTTTTKPKQPSTTKRLHTLKPVSYYKQPSFGANSQPEPPKVISYLSNMQQQRPMQRPAALSNLMASSTQATRPPVKLDPSPLYSKGLEASTINLDEDLRAFARLCNELAFSYWKSITSEKISSARSLVMSPFALTSMLSMVFLGARGSTSGEMNEVLKLDDMVTFNPHLVFKNITESVEKATDGDIATAAFVREIFSDRSNGKLLQFFKEKTQQFYGSHVEEVNFNVVNDIIRRRTNFLIKRHTMGKVLEYLRTNSVWVNGPLATISANLFQTDCTRSSTQDRDGEMFFQVHPSVRQRRLVPIPAVLYRSGFTAGYESKLDATVVAFGRIEDTVSTIYVMPGHQSLISPTDSLDRLEKDLVDLAFSQNAWSGILTSVMDRPGLEVQLPRFSHRSFVNASLGLQKMGLKGLFKSDFADLRGLTGSANRDIYLSDMIQINTFSTCGEERISDHHHVEMYPAPPLRKRNKDMDATEDDDFDSSEAIIDFGSLVHESALARGFYDDLLDPKYLELPLPLRPRQARVPDAPRLRFDKPFLYFVRHNPTGMILFMGRFNPRLLP